MTTLGNGVEFSDLMANGSVIVHQPTRGIFAGFYPSPYTIEYITFSTDGDSVDFVILIINGKKCWFMF